MLGIISVKFSQIQLYYADIIGEGRCLCLTVYKEIGYDQFVRLWAPRWKVPMWWANWSISQDNRKMAKYLRDQYV